MHGARHFAGEHHVHLHLRLAHHRRGAVLWKIVRRITPGILLGTFLGTFVASRLSTGFLRVFFCVFLYVIATQMLLNKNQTLARELPARAACSGWAASSAWSRPWWASVASLSVPS